MPYTENDPKLPDKIKQLPARRRRQWVNVWNSVYERCQAGDGQDCEAAAFRQANGVIARADEGVAKMIDVGGLNIPLESLLAAMKRPQGGQREMLRQAQAARAKKFGIAIQPGGALTIPANFARLGASEGDFADPTNYRYVIWLTRPNREALNSTQLGQVRNAPARFEQFKARYDPASRAAVERRIEEALKKFKIGRFAEPEQMEKAWRCQVFKQDAERQIAYSVALKASGGQNGLRPDTQRDLLSAEEVERAAHFFMLESRTFDLHHQEALSQQRAAVVESYLAPVDFQAGGTQIMKGDWIVGVKLFDPELWEAVKRGEINAFSIRGIGRRKPLQAGELT